MAIKDDIIVAIKKIATNVTCIVSIDWWCFFLQSISNDIYNRYKHRPD